VNATTGKLYVSDMDAGELAVFDTSTGKRITTVPLGLDSNFVRRAACRVAVDEGRNRVYATMSRANALAAVDGERDVLLGRVELGPPLPTDPWAYVRLWDMRVVLNRSTQMAYVIDAHNMLLSSVDTETLELNVQRGVGMLENPLRPPLIEESMKMYENNLQNLAIDEKRDLVYLWTWIFEGRSLKLVGRLDPQLGTGVTFVDTESDRLYVHGPQGLAVVDAETHERVGLIPMSDNSLTQSEIKTLWGVDPVTKVVYAVRNIMTTSRTLEVYGIE
jgi:YVTN family beta-propeller protein